MDLSEYKELSLKEHKKITLDILIEVAKFCDAHNLRYYLAYGTLLGAIRHRGFIPWDDDIDIQMPREDYEKFIALFSASEHSDLKVVTPNSLESKHTFLKIVNKHTIKIEKAINYNDLTPLGVDIDVFPLDGQPNGKMRFNIYYKRKQKLYLYYLMLILDKNDMDKKKIPLFLLGHFYVKNILRLDKQKIMQKIDKINRNYSIDKSDFIGCTSSLYNSINNRHKKELYSDRVWVDFEGYKFYAPIGYDAVLIQMYGDYMQLPPKEQQVTHHKNKVYIRRPHNEKV